MNNNSKIKKNLFPGGKIKAFTLSYDDAVLQDKKLLDILNNYGLKSTFNLNSGWFGQVDCLDRPKYKVDHSHVNAGEVRELYKNHEVAIHTVNHPSLTKLDEEDIVKEVLEDKRSLEDIVGYPVRGMAYPAGRYDQRVISILRSLGIEYARTVAVHYEFTIPEDFLEWKATCHHLDERLFEIANKFIELTNSETLQLFYVWGHSYEFDIYSKWEMIDEFCRLMSGHSDIWYASNIEVVDYINALNNLKISMNEEIIYNPSCMDVWVTVEGEPTVIKGGSTWRKISR